MRSTTARSHCRLILGAMLANSPTTAPAMMPAGFCSTMVAAAPMAVGMSSPSVARKFSPPPDERCVGRLVVPGTRSVLGGIGGISPASAVEVDDHVVEREAQRAGLAEE